MKYRIMQAVCAIASITAAIFLWNWFALEKATGDIGKSSAAVSLTSLQETEQQEERKDHAPHGILRTPIEQIRVGDRVLAHNPEVSGSERSEFVEPDQTWKQIELVLERQDQSAIEIVLLRPKHWVQENDAEAGALIYVDLPEMGAEGDAKVISISEAPPIDEGEGCVVTATFKHTPTDEIFNLLIEGESEPIGVTGAHPFWLVERQEFVPVSQLEPGDVLLGRDGTNRKFVSVLPRPEPEPVYNIEVHGEHVYRVASEGLLVHNSYSGIRTLHPSQYDLTGLKAGEVVRDSGRIRDAIGGALKASEKHTTEMMGLMKYLRGGRGGGFLGITKNPVSKPGVVLKNYKTSDGVIVAGIDINRIPAKDVFDLSDPTLRSRFMGTKSAKGVPYSRYGAMYDRIASEGVVAIRGEIPLEAVIGIVRIHKGASDSTIIRLIEQLLE